MSRPITSEAAAAHGSTIATTPSTRGQPSLERPCSSTATVSATERQTTVVKAIRRPVGQRESIVGLTLPERSRDHEALDLVRALVDLRDLGVAHVALDRLFRHVAIPAEHLD